MCTCSNDNDVDDDDCNDIKDNDFMCRWPTVCASSVLNNTEQKKKRIKLK